MRISPDKMENYEPRTTKPSYSIEFERIADQKELLCQFRRVYRTAKYQHDKNYPDTAIALCLSEVNGNLARTVKVKTGKRGRPKKGFEKRVKNSPIDYRAKPHIHFLAVGKGSRSLVERICRNENKRAKKSVAKYWSNRGYAPLAYIRDQASSYRQIGDFSQHINNM